MGHSFWTARGISAIDLLVVCAAVAITVSFAIPKFSDQTIRSRVSEGLLLVDRAKEALQTTCANDPGAVVNGNLDAGFLYVPAGTEDDFVKRILLGADCAQDSMVIVIWTSSTGAERDPVVEWTAEVNPDPAGAESGQALSWNCRLIQGESEHVPAACRNAYRGV
ncbi:MAG: pilin [Xanthomonadales bacterium]|nr:pilin [Xanthomonadales bacterium]